MNQVTNQLSHSGNSTPRDKGMCIWPCLQSKTIHLESPALSRGSHMKLFPTSCLVDPNPRRSSQQGRSITAYLPSLGRMHVDTEVEPQGRGEGQAEAVPGAGGQPQVPADRHELQQVGNHQALLILHKTNRAGLRNCTSPSSASSWPRSAQIFPRTMQGKHPDA